jgi:hypothetical protein
MELRKLQVEVPGNERRNSARRFGVDEQIADNGTGSEDRLIRAISSTIKVVEAAWIATSVIPNHRHGPRVAGNIERSDATTADNDGKEGGAIFVRSGQEDLASGPSNVTNYRAVGKDPGLLNEGNVPSEIGHVSPTSLKGSHIDRQNNRARAGAGGLANEDLPAVASL